MSRFANTIVLLAFLPAFVITGCSKEAAKAGEKGKETPKTAANPLEIKADAGLLQRIRVGESSSGEVGASISVAGRVDVDITRITRVGSPVMGRITSLEVQEGREVKRGELLALLNSTGFRTPSWTC